MPQISQSIGSTSISSTQPVDWIHIHLIYPIFSRVCGVVKVTTRVPGDHMGALALRGTTPTPPDMYTIHTRRNRIIDIDIDKYVQVSGGARVPPITSPPLAPSSHLDS